MNTSPSSVWAKRLSRRSMAALFVLGSSSSLFADATWTGLTSSDWNDVSNWSGDPSGQTLFINNTGNAGAFPVITATPSFTPVDLRIGTGSTGRVDQTAGTAGSGSGSWTYLGYSGATATYNLADTAASGGTFTGFGLGSGNFSTGRLIMGLDNGTTSTFNMNTTGSLTVTDILYVGGTGAPTSTFNLDNGTVNANALEIAGRQFGQTSGTGQFRMSGGTVSVAGVTNIAPADNNAGTQTGILTVTGGSFTSEGDMILGFAGSSSASATVNISGGSVNVASTTKRWVVVSRWDTVNSTMTVSGGSLNLNADTDLRYSISNNSGTNTVTLSGGAITSYSGNLTGDGAGVIDLNQGGGAATNTFNLDGGTLSIHGIISASNNGTAKFNFNGGTLKATGDDANFVDLGGAGQRANVRNGGAIIDTNGYNVTAVEALQHSDIGGDNATDGGLLKQGAGTLTLAGVNTYTGATTINNGTLALSGSIASTTIGFNLTNSTAGDLSILNPGFTFSGTLNLGLAAVTMTNSWTLFTGASFDSGDLDLLGGVTSDLGSFTNGGSGIWNLTSGGGSWSFNDNSGVLMFAAVPEPSETALVVIALLGCLIAVRLKRVRN